MPKRKKDDEYRTCKNEWTEEFAFVEGRGSAVCLICNAQVSFFVVTPPLPRNGGTACHQLN